MKRSNIKRKPPLTPAQLQAKMEYALAKQRQRANNSLAQPKTNKYRNKPVWHDGIRFKSILERDHYKDFKLMEIAGLISEYKYEEPFELHFNGVKIGHIEPDHFYYDHEINMHVISDTKSEKTMTDLWKWKWKHLKLEYPQYVYEVRLKTKVIRYFPKRDQEIEDYQRRTA